MKRVNKLAAAIALALSAGVVAPNAGAIELKSNGLGDALIFPAYEGRIDNYFTVSNSSNQWIQGHLRFRGAGWTAELRDFDVILSPGDVFVFRLADLDGDGQQEIDQSLDPKNFAYTGQTYSCGAVSNCLELNTRLIEPVKSVVSETDYEHQRLVGYVEFYGESVLTGMTQAIMADLLSASPNSANKPYQDELYARTGTNAWRWSDAPEFDACFTPGSSTRAGLDAGNSRCDMGLGDVGNWLSGSAFLLIPGRSSGLAYNAEAFVDFRTAENTHRINNYRRLNYVALSSWVGANDAVILHHESGEYGSGTSPVGDYVYHYIPEGDEDRFDESRISFNNTWGPTLADGDDYYVSTAEYVDLFDTEDYWDDRFDNDNSIVEVEEAITTAGQTFTSYYFANGRLAGSALNSWYFVLFPTKYYYGEDRDYWRATVTSNSVDEYIKLAVRKLLSLGKPLNVEIWDINEVPGGQTVGGCISPDPCAIVTSASLGHELSFFGVDYFKTVFNTSTAQSFTSGRVVVDAKYKGSRPNSLGSNIVYAFPMLGYTFESGGADVIGQWRSMNH